MAVYVKSLDKPEASEEYDGDGVAEAVQIGPSVVWRSRLKPGWSWEKNAKPRMGGAEFCPAWHREYVVSGRILYRLHDGTSVEGRAGDYLVIEPGHAAEVLGDEECVLLDWYGRDPDDAPQPDAHEGHDHEDHGDHEGHEGHQH